MDAFQASAFQNDSTGLVAAFQVGALPASGFDADGVLPRHRSDEMLERERETRLRDDEGLWLLLT